MIQTEKFEQVTVTSAAELEVWLAANHAQDASVWLVTFKSHLPEKYVSRDDVLDGLLAWGWIDGIRRKRDADTTMQLISPRKTQHWAKSYKDRVARLAQEGRMRPPGRAVVDCDKASGLWNFMDDVDALIQPEDLVAALSTDGKAHFDAAAPSYRRNVLRWIKLAKTPATRAARIAKVADFASRNRRIPQM